MSDIWQWTYHAGSKTYEGNSRFGVAKIADLSYVAEVFIGRSEKPIRSPSFLSIHSAVNWCEDLFTTDAIKVMDELLRQIDHEGERNLELMKRLEAARKRIAEMEANQPIRESRRPAVEWEWDNGETIWTGRVGRSRRCGIYVDEAGLFCADVRPVDGGIVEAKLPSLAEAKAWCEREVANVT